MIHGGGKPQRGPLKGMSPGLTTEVTAARTRHRGRNTQGGLGCLWVERVGWGGGQWEDSG